MNQRAHPSQISIAAAMAIFGAALMPATAKAVEAEQVFRDAVVYTVKIRSRIETAFIEDERSSSSGAGFVIDSKRGWIMTNAHVVGRSPSEIRVAFKEKPFVEARKVYVDPYLDLAILRLGKPLPKILTSAPLNCDDIPSVGHPVGAFGHPWGLDFTGTRGIISGTTDEGALQMDAAINPGNSGGPLISLKTGRVVGINTETTAEERDQNTNFAVPMVYACRVLRILQDGKDPSPPRLAVVFREPPLDRKALVVARIYWPKGLLDLKAGDEILGVGGRKNHIVNEAQLVHALRGGLDQVAVKVKRRGKERIVRGRLEPLGLITKRVGVMVSGMLIGPRIFRDAAVLGADNGLVIHSVEPGSAGDVLNFRAGDVVTDIDGAPYRELRPLMDHLVKAEKAKQPVTLTVLRGAKADWILFGYMVRELPLYDLKWISGQ
ncbi:MAG: trypsin-like peptidase domain-containing protein [Alphaproteobacteria bacterium]